ncbi:hypothetical protein OV203_31675 [Nannocystis sp. ILAH1]|nr:hypothetical protein [Nannocystis sp. ILAH1]MCY0991745.1 hypothetical protein [Nannocystis sp. ILAH1]
MTTPVTKHAVAPPEQAFFGIGVASHSMVSEPEAGMVQVRPA